MAKVSVTSKSLRVSVGWFEALRALKGSFEVPLTQVRGATDDPNYRGFGELGMRSPGTGLPGLVADGTFRKNGQKVLSLWRRGQEVVVVELDGFKWDRLVLGCEDAKALASIINKAITK